ncbi:hypothetical protein OSB04_010938 [Centaurea solstitialis]|uniref:Uncharacterized protein n=1 Tax=Centaurea solstitialis TaxID=347529 RepID=A0AA38WNM4_9ASTR|nr:hypothetical protein OSB04_010938 [Centaurea solstitialis]
MGEETMQEVNHVQLLDDDIKRQDFPSNFHFGVATSAFQVWGTQLREVQMHVSAVDNYSRMKEDVQLLKKMGVSSYRFSISWPRILPGGKLSMGKNQEGINHYNKLIDELLANGIEPFVTLFHWDLPNALEEEYMGFLSTKVVDDFLDYADICFWGFGDRVKNWITLNEPQMFAYAGYVKGIFACKDSDLETEPYMVAYNLLNCHAAAYRKYEKDYKSFQNGKVGITLNFSFWKPYRGTSNPDDVKAVEYAFDFSNGWFLEPLVKGKWPENMYKFATTETPNHPKGRTLPEFSDVERTKLIDSYDFLGVNYYTASFAQYQAPSADIPLGYTTDGHFKTSGQDPNGHDIGEPAFKGSWVYLCPNELTELLYRVKNTYNVSKPIIITENGSPDLNEPGKTFRETRNDTYRMEYIKKHLTAIRTAIRNNVNVSGYFVWSFMDSFEWTAGYGVRFGMIYVDYFNNLQRYPKDSALWYTKFLSEKNLLKRALDGTEKVNDARFEAEKAFEMNPKLKKARAV